MTRLYLIRFNMVASESDNLVCDGSAIVVAEMRLVHVRLDVLLTWHLLACPARDMVEPSACQDASAFAFQEPAIY